MFKIGMALIFAVIAALVTVIAGLLGTPRLLTVFLRALLAFVVVWGVSWLVLFILEAKGVVGFDRNLELLSDADENPTDEELAAHAAEAEAEDAEKVSQPDDGEESAEEEPAGFQPLSTDNLKHMDTTDAS